MYNQAQTPVYFDNLMLTATTGPMMEVNAYYPFGVIIPNLSTIAGGDKDNAYKYNGKELQDKMNLNWLDYGARMLPMYTPVWMVPDLLAEKYYSLSPYVYCGNNPINRIDPNGLDWYEAENGNVMWRRSQDKEYTDDDGNPWKNIGENYVFISGNNTTLFQQHKNDKGELSLQSSSYNLENQKENDNFSSALGDILSQSSGISGAVGGLAEDSKATFRLTNSKGMLDVKLYGNGWRDNQWVTPTKFAQVGKYVNTFGKVAGVLGTGISLYQFTQATTLDGKIEYGLDTFMNGMGFVPVIGTGVSLYWSFGGKKPC